VPNAYKHYFHKRSANRQQTVTDAMFNYSGNTDDDKEMMKILAVTVEKYNACEQTEGHIFRHLK
jgi:hypothetical protein